MGSSLVKPSRSASFKGQANAAKVSKSDGGPTGNAQKVQKNEGYKVDPLAGPVSNYCKPVTVKEPTVQPSSYLSQGKTVSNDKLSKNKGSKTNTSAFGDTLENKSKATSQTSTLPQIGSVKSNKGKSSSLKKGRGDSSVPDLPPIEGQKKTSRSRRFFAGSCVGKPKDEEFESKKSTSTGASSGKKQIVSGIVKKPIEATGRAIGPEKDDKGASRDARTPSAKYSKRNLCKSDSSPVEKYTHSKCMENITIVSPPDDLVRTFIPQTVNEVGDVKTVNQKEFITQSSFTIDCDPDSDRYQDERVSEIQPFSTENVESVKISKVSEIKSNEELLSQLSHGDAQTQKTLIGTNVAKDDLELEKDDDDDESSVQVSESVWAHGDVRKTVITQNEHFELDDVQEKESVTCLVGDKPSVLEGAQSVAGTTDKDLEVMLGYGKSTDEKEEELVTDVLTGKTLNIPPQEINVHACTEGLTFYHTNPAFEVKEQQGDYKIELEKENNFDSLANKYPAQKENDLVEASDIATNKIENEANEVISTKFEEPGNYFCQEAFENVKSSDLDTSTNDVRSMNETNSDTHIFQDNKLTKEEGEDEKTDAALGISHAEDEAEEDKDFPETIVEVDTEAERTVCVEDDEVSNNEESMNVAVDEYVGGVLEENKDSGLEAIHDMDDIAKENNEMKEDFVCDTNSEQGQNVMEGEGVNDNFETLHEDEDTRLDELSRQANIVSGETPERLRVDEEDYIGQHTPLEEECKDYTEEVKDDVELHESGSKLKNDEETENTFIADVQQDNVRSDDVLAPENDNLNEYEDEVSKPFETVVEDPNVDHDTADGNEQNIERDFSKELCNEIPCAEEKADREIEENQVKAYETEPLKATDTEIENSILKYESNQCVDNMLYRNNDLDKCVDDESVTRLTVDDKCVDDKGTDEKEILEEKSYEVTETINDDIAGNQEVITQQNTVQPDATLPSNFTANDNVEEVSNKGDTQSGNPSACSSANDVTQSLAKPKESVYESNISSDINRPMSNVQSVGEVDPLAQKSHLSANEHASKASSNISIANEDQSRASIKASESDLQQEKGNTESTYAPDPTLVDADPNCLRGSNITPSTPRSRPTSAKSTHHSQQEPVDAGSKHSLCQKSTHSSRHNLSRSLSNHSSRHGEMLSPRPPSAGPMRHSPRPPSTELSLHVPKPPSVSKSGEGRVRGIRSRQSSLNVTGSKTSVKSTHSEVEASASRVSVKGSLENLKQSDSKLSANEQSVHDSKSHISGKEDVCQADPNVSPSHESKASAGYVKTSDSKISAKESIGNMVASDSNASVKISATQLQRSMSKTSAKELSNTALASASNISAKEPPSIIQESMSKTSAKESLCNVVTSTSRTSAKNSNTQLHKSLSKTSAREYSNTALASASKTSAKESSNKVEESASKTSAKDPSERSVLPDVMKPLSDHKLSTLSPGLSSIGKTDELASLPPLKSADGANRLPPIRGVGGLLGENRPSFENWTSSSQAVRLPPMSTKPISSLPQIESIEKTKNLGTLGTLQASTLPPLSSSFRDTDQTDKERYMADVKEDGFLNAGNNVENKHSYYALIDVQPCSQPDTNKEDYAYNKAHEDSATPGAMEGLDITTRVNNTINDIMTSLHKTPQIESELKEKIEPPSITITAAEDCQRAAMSMHQENEIHNIMASLNKPTNEESTFDQLASSYKGTDNEGKPEETPNSVSEAQSEENKANDGMLSHSKLSSGDRIKDIMSSYNGSAQYDTHNDNVTASVNVAEETRPDGGLSYVDAHEETALNSREPLSTNTAMNEEKSTLQDVMTSYNVPKQEEGAENNATESEHNNVGIDKKVENVTASTDYYTTQYAPAGVQSTVEEGSVLNETSSQIVSNNQNDVSSAVYDSSKDDRLKKLMAGINSTPASETIEEMMARINRTSLSANLKDETGAQNDILESSLKESTTENKTLENEEGIKATYEPSYPESKDEEKARSGNMIYNTTENENRVEDCMTSVNNTESAETNYLNKTLDETEAKGDSFRLPERLNDLCGEKVNLTGDLPESPVEEPKPEELNINESKLMHDYRHSTDLPDYKTSFTEKANTLITTDTEEKPAEMYTSKPSIKSNSFSFMSTTHAPTDYSNILNKYSRVLKEPSETKMDSDSMLPNSRTDMSMYEGAHEDLAKDSKPDEVTTASLSDYRYPTITNECKTDLERPNTLDEYQSEQPENTTGDSPLNQAKAPVTSTIADIMAKYSSECTDFEKGFDDTEIAVQRESSEEFQEEQPVSDDTLGTPCVTEEEYESVQQSQDTDECETEKQSMDTDECETDKQSQDTDECETEKQADSEDTSSEEPKATSMFDYQSVMAKYASEKASATEVSQDNALNEPNMPAGSDTTQSSLNTENTKSIENEEKSSTLLNKSPILPPAPVETEGASVERPETFDSIKDYGGDDHKVISNCPYTETVLSTGDGNIQRTDVKADLSPKVESVEEILAKYRCTSNVAPSTPLSLGEPIQSEYARAFARGESYHFTANKDTVKKQSLSMNEYSTHLTGVENFTHEADIKSDDKTKSSSEDQTIGEKLNIPGSYISTMAEINKKFGLDYTPLSANESMDGADSTKKFDISSSLGSSFKYGLTQQEREKYGLSNFSSSLPQRDMGFTGDSSFTTNFDATKTLTPQSLPGMETKDLTVGTVDVTSNHRPTSGAIHDGAPITESSNTKQASELEVPETLPVEKISTIKKQIYEEGLKPCQRDGGVAFFIPASVDGLKPPNTTPDIEQRLAKPKRQSMTYEERMMMADINRHNHLSKKKEFAVKDLTNVKTAVASSASPSGESINSSTYNMHDRSYRSDRSDAGSNF